MEQVAEPVIAHALHKGVQGPCADSAGGNGLAGAGQHFVLDLIEFRSPTIADILRHHDGGGGSGGDGDRCQPTSLEPGFDGCLEITHPTGRELFLRWLGHLLGNRHTRGHGNRCLCAVDGWCWCRLRCLWSARLLADLWLWRRALHARALVLSGGRCLLLYPWLHLSDWCALALSLTHGDFGLLWLTIGAATLALGVKARCAGWPLDALFRIEFRAGIALFATTIGTGGLWFAWPVRFAAQGNRAQTAPPPAFLRAFQLKAEGIGQCLAQGLGLTGEQIDSHGRFAGNLVIGIVVIQAGSQIGPFVIETVAVGGGQAINCLLERRMAHGVAHDQNDPGQGQPFRQFLIGQFGGNLPLDPTQGRGLTHGQGSGDLIDQPFGRAFLLQAHRVRWLARQGGHALVNEQVDVVCGQHITHASHLVLFTICCAITSSGHRPTAIFTTDSALPECLTPHLALPVSESEG